MKNIINIFVVVINTDTSKLKKKLKSKNVPFYSNTKM